MHLLLHTLHHTWPSFSSSLPSLPPTTPGLKIGLPILLITTKALGKTRQPEVFAYISE